MLTPDISLIGLLLCSILLVIPFVTSILLRMRITRSMGVAVLRMIVQLFLIGIFLKYLFIWNHAFLNVAWLMVMIGVATFNATNKIKLKFHVFVFPTFVAFSAATLLVLLYIMTFVLDVGSIVDARFFVVIGGMLLGNSLRGNIIGIDNFYSLLRRNTNRYQYRLAMGATVLEALFPYFRDSLRSALQPTIATMATMGIVFLPGLMTGQILGGLSPLVAIKYQFVIMVAIFTSTTIAISLTILFTLRTCFDRYGVLRQEVFTQ
ncbi:ABC transporter permease [candidate division WOR-3 bacterium]|nr:ABC transporter permease [candidate division WOR-3 bacterium]